MSESLARTRKTWERLGQADPLWAVLSTPGRRDGAWDMPYFLHTGRIDLGDVLRLMEPAGVDFGDHVLDFGCGVGRLSQVLAERAKSVVGIDIAESMIDLAERLNQVGERVRFVHHDSELLPFADNTFDSALTLMVIQHLPPQLALRGILELVRVVRPGGILAMQIPSHPLVPPPLPTGTCRAGIGVVAADSTLAPGTAGQVRAAVTNTGDGVWPADASVKLANHWLRDGERVGGDDGRCEVPHAVRPGETVTLDLRVTAPENPGDYQLELDIVQEFVAWWADLGSPTTRVPVLVAEPGQAAPNRNTAAGSLAVEVVHSEPLADAGQPAETGAPPAVRDAEIEMHPLPVPFVRSLLERLGADVLAVGEDDLAGPGWASYTYIARIGAA